MTTDAQTIIGIIENIEIKDAPPESGKDWRLFAFKIRGPAGTHRYSTFDKNWPTNLVGGKTYRFTFTEKQGDKGMLRDLTSATLVDPSEFGVQPSSNGEAEQPYEPPTDEAKERVATGEPQPELKSPSRSYDQNRDIDRRSIERQVALKAAVDMLKDYGTSKENVDLMPEAVMACANAFFAWLRETPSDVRSSPVEPVSAAVGTGEPTDYPMETPAESDGGSALFPPEQTSTSPSATKPHHFADAGSFRKALKDEYGLATAADVNKALDEAGWGPLAQVGNLDEAFAAIAAHRQQPDTGKV